MVLVILLYGVKGLAHIYKIYVCEKLTWVVMWHGRLHTIGLFGHEYINEVGHVVILCKIVGHMTCMMFLIVNANFAQKEFNVHIFWGRHAELHKQYNV